MSFVVFYRTEERRTEVELRTIAKGPLKGSRHCDFLEVIRFLSLFQKNAKNVYQIYHSSLHFDLKKVYRYLRYCMGVGLIKIDHVEEEGFLPAKYYCLTPKGRALVEMFKEPDWFRR